MPIRKEKLDAIPYYRDAKKKTEEAGTGSSASSRSQTGGTTQSAAAGKKAVIKREKLDAIPGYKDQTARNATSGYRSSDRNNQAARQNYASRHPEETGGELGAIIRGLNSQSVYLNAGQKELEELPGRLGAEKDSSGKLVFSTQEDLDAYNGLLNQYNQNLNAYNDYLSQYQRYTSADGIRERMDAAREKRDKASRDHSLLTQLETGGSQDAGLYGNVDYTTAGEARDAYNRYDAEYKQLLNQYYYAENKGNLDAVGQDQALSSSYTGAKELQDDMDRIAVVADDAVNHNGGAEAAEARDYLFQKYGLTQQAIDNYAAGGQDYRPEGAGYTNLFQLYDELSARKEQAVKTLGSSGYDYERMTGYEQMLQDAEEYAKKQEAWTQWANEHPVLSSIDTLLFSPLQGADFLTTMAGNIGHNNENDPGSYVPMNVYNMDVTNYVDTVRGTVSRELEENTDWELFGQNMASFLYQTGMSVADSALQVGVAGMAGAPSAATLFMGASAASNQAKNVIERGGTNSQAFWGGLAAGAAEVIFEKVSIDSLLKVKNVDSILSWLRETAKQAGVEASEEMFTEIANILSDAAVMGENSDFAHSVDEYMAQGMSRDAAKKQAYLDCVGQVAWAGAGGALSGGIMGGTVNGMNAISYNADIRQSGSEFRAMGDDVVQAMIREGLSSDPSTRSYQLAQELQKRLDAGKPVTDRELGILYHENVRTIEEEESKKREQSGPDVDSTLLDAAREAVSSGTRATEGSAARTTLEATALQDTQSTDQARKVASALGENGRKALKTVYDGQGDPDAFASGFADYYNAGVSGREISSVRSEYSVRLNQAQKFAAYAAGQNDAEVSLARERRAAQYAKVAGTDSGLVFDDYVADELDTAVAERVNIVAKALGVRVRFVDSVRGGTANAQVSGSDILVEKNNPNPVMFLLGHEWTHRMQELAPTEYRAFRDAVAEEVQGEARVLLDQYRRAGENISYEEALDEAAANYAGRMIEDGKVLDDFIEKHRDNRTLLEKVRDAIRSIIAKLTGAERRKAQTAEGKLTAALEASAKQAEKLVENKNTAIQQDGDAKFSIKRTSQMTLAAQLKMFYDGKMASSDAFYFGETPDTLAAAGLDPLPLAFTVSDFRKSAKEKHNVPRRVWKNLHDSLENALFAFRLGDRVGIMTGDIDGDGKPLLVGIERNAVMDRKPVNAIRSVYGLDNPGPWLQNQFKSGKEYIPMNKQRADAFLQTYGAYSASVGDGIRSLDGTVTQNEPESNGKFSLKTPVEETKNLLAIHNKDEASILSALELGGLPMPSIAVVKSTDGHSQYGPISLVFSKDTIDPQADSRNKVYGADAWTPTHSNARIEYEVNYDALRRFDNMVANLTKDFAGGALYHTSPLGGIVSEETSDDINKIAEKLSRQTSVQAAYLSSTGENVEPVYAEKKFDTLGNDLLKRYIDSIGSQELARLVVELETTGKVPDDALEAVRGIIVEDWAERNKSRLNKKPELIEKYKKVQHDRIDEYRAERFIRNAWDYYEDAGTTTGEIDRYATAEKVTIRLSELSPEGDFDSIERMVKDWVIGEIDGLLGEPGIYNGADYRDQMGNRKSFNKTHWPVTLENIVRAMNNASSRGANMWGYGAEGLVATATPEYGSVEEIRADNGRLQKVPEDEYKQIMSDLDAELNDVIVSIMDTTEAHSDNRFEEQEIIGYIIGQAASGKRTEASIKRTFSREGYTITTEQANAIKDLLNHAANVPTGYFEAKPQRAVGFDEVLAAVIPDDSSEKLRTGLERAGVRMLEYKSGDDTDRLAKVNSVEGARFSLKTDSQGRTLTEQQREYFKDSKAVDGQGRLLVLYHGTGAKFTVFDKTRIGENFADRGSDLGFYFSPYVEDANGYAREAAGHRGNGEVMQVYLNLKNPLVIEDEGWGSAIGQADIRHGDLKRWAQDGGYDGIIVKSTDIEMDDDGTPDAVYIAFSPNQIKSTDNKAPTSDPDIRYSLKGSETARDIAAIQKENERLRGQVERWKGQLKQTTPETRTLRQGDVDKLALELVKRYDSTLKASDISADLKELGEFIIRGGDGKNELTWAGVHERALGIAKQIVDNAVVVDDEVYQQYSELRSYLKSTRLNISDEDSRSITDYGDFRKRNMGRINLGKGSTNIDQVYMEMSSLWPEFFDEQRETNPADKLLHIEDVLDSLQPIYGNPYSYDMAAASEYVAGDIVDSLMGEDVRQAPPTYADKQARKLEEAKAKGRQQVQKVREQSSARLEELRKQNRQRVQDAIAKERDRRNERVQKLKEHYAEVRKNQAERRADSKARTRLLNIARRLQNKKLPAVSRALLDQYIGDLDTVSKSMTGKTLEKLSDLQAWYSDRKENDPDFISDPVIEKKLARLSKRQIADMTAEEVADLTDALLNIENELRNERKLIDTEDRRDTYHMGEETIDNIYNTKGSSRLLDKYIVTQTLSPVRQVRRMTGYVDSDPLYRMTEGLADGQRAMLDYQMKAERPFEKFASDKAFSRTFSGPKAERIQISGLTRDGIKTVSITPAMRTALYLHSLNDQNLRHIKEGGITVPDEKLYRAGKLEEAYARGTTIKLTPSQVRSITAGMTEKEKAFARAAQRYFNETSRTAINETSEKLKGYSLAKVENYFPINTDSSFTRSDFESLKFDGTIEGMGFLKERVNAANPIMLRDANAVLEQAIQMHGKYVGLAIPVRNFNKVLGVTTASFSEDGSRNSFESSVQQAIKKQWGAEGYKYIEKMMTDLQGGGGNKNVWTKALNKVRSNYAGAVLTLNLSVAMKQAASYPTAAAVLGWRPLVKALGDFSKVNIDTVAKYTPLLWYRSKGFSTKELGDMKSANRQLPPLLNWVQGVDVATTKKLWRASEYYIRQNNKALTVGTDAYWRAVADIYNRVIEETQPNYTTMQRPQLLRSDDTLMSTLAMFKTQPFQNFNIVYDAACNFMAKAERAKTGGEQEKADVKKARTDLGHAITSQIAQLAVFAGMTMAWSLLRGRKDKYEDEDGDMTVQSVLTALGKDMVGGAFSGVPFGSDAWELLSSKVFGDAYYGMDTVTVTAISDTVQSFFAMAEQVGRIAKNAATGNDTDWNAERLKLDSELDDISKAAGIPYENVVNMFKIVCRSAAIASQGEYMGGYAYLKLTTDPKEHKSDYYDLLYKALTHGEYDNYDDIRGDLMEELGADGTEIDEAMRERYNKAVKKDPDYEIPDRSKDLIGIQDQYEVAEKPDSFGADDLDAASYRLYSQRRADSYRAFVNSLEDSGGFQNLDNTAKNKALNSARNLAADMALRDSSSGQFTDADLSQWERWASGGADWGVDETEAILFKLAYEMAESDKDEDGKTISGSKKENTLEAVEDLMPWLTDLELEYLMSNYWTPEDRELKAMKENGFME